MKRITLLILCFSAYAIIYSLIFGSSLDTKESPINKESPPEKIIEEKGPPKPEPKIEMEPEPESPSPKLVAHKIMTTRDKTVSPIVVRPIPEYLDKSIQWLADAQMPNGGWGAGQHTRQKIRDPKAVKTDPATTAFCAIALARSGSTLERGTYKSHLKKALDYLLECVESTPGNTFNITPLTGTQPQRKLGENIDVSMAIQFFGKVLHEGVKNEDYKQRISYAMDRCIGMLEETQQNDGSWNTAGWAPVLNSVMANNALEISQTIGKNVDDMLDQSQNYQTENLDASGKVRTDKSAGIALYSLSSTQRATARDSKEATEAFEEMRQENEDLPEPKTEEEAYDVLRKKYSEKKAKKLAYSYRANQSAKKQLDDDAVLSGFGNNGGEEYLSYMMTSESFVAEGDEQAWSNWHKKITQLFGKVQNGNGTWTGQHCITSPTFCTAAVIMALTADRDAEILMAGK